MTNHRVSRGRRTDEWTLRLPWNKPPLNLNDRTHWRTKAATTKGVRDAAQLLAAGIIGHATGPIEVTLTYYPRDNRRRDADNLVATLKALCDGLVDAGITPDDTPEHMVKHMPIIGRADGDPRLELTVRRLT